LTGCSPADERASEIDPTALERDRRVGLSTAAALCAFAGNSLLTRLALGHMTIDAATFATLRLAAGAAMLAVATAVTRPGTLRVSGSWLAATALFFYAVPFSYAYVSLTAGTGTLILIASIQVTMLLLALLAGERPGAVQWLGLQPRVRGPGVPRAAGPWVGARRGRSKRRPAILCGHVRS
jgi:hypothetical protein